MHAVTAAPNTRCTIIIMIIIFYHHKIIIKNYSETESQYSLIFIFSEMIVGNCFQVILLIVI